MISISNWSSHVAQRLRDIDFNYRWNQSFGNLIVRHINGRSTRRRDAYKRHDCAFTIHGYRYVGIQGQSMLVSFNPLSFGRTETHLSNDKTATTRPPSYFWLSVSRTLVFDFDVVHQAICIAGMNAMSVVGSQPVSNHKLSIFWSVIFATWISACEYLKLIIDSFDFHFVEWCDQIILEILKRSFDLMLFDSLA